MTLLPFILSAILIAQDDPAVDARRARTRDLLSSYKAAIQDRNEAAKGRLMQEILGLGRPAVLEIEAQKKAWEQANGAQIRGLEEKIARITLQQQKIQERPAPAPGDPEALLKLERELEGLRSRLAPLRGWIFLLDTLLAGLQAKADEAAWWAPKEPDDEPAWTLMRSYLAAWLSGDEAGRLRILEELVKAGPAAVAQVRRARGAWLGNQSKRLREYKEMEDQAATELDRLAEEGKLTGDLERQVLERARSARKAASLLQSQIVHLEALEVDVDLRCSGAQGKAVRNSLEATLRSFVHFAGQSQWKAAATCVSPSTEEQARRLAAAFDGLGRGASKGPWSLASTYCSDDPGLRCVLVIGDILDVCSYEGPRFTFSGASGFLEFAGDRNGFTLRRVIAGSDYSAGRP